MLASQGVLAEGRNETGTHRSQAFWEVGEPWRMPRARSFLFNSITVIIMTGIVVIIIVIIKLL